MRLNPDTLEWLSHIYLVANTPLYLYRKLRNELSVEQLAQVHRPTELVQFITEVDRENDRSASRVAAAYAATVALTYHPPGAVAEALAQAPPVRHLNWVADILAIWEQSRISTTVESHRVPVQWSRAEPSLPSTSVTDNLKTPIALSPTPTSRSHGLAVTVERTEDVADV